MDRRVLLGTLAGSVLAAPLASLAVADDPVSAGLVQSLARPGGRLTGITSLNVDLDGKRLQILKSALPGASRVLLIATPRDPTFRDRMALAERGCPFARPPDRDR
jgi:putative ABC transport system substrate-binding protein